MSRLSRLRLFQHCCIFAHCVTKMPLRRKRTDAKTQKHLLCPFGFKLFPYKTTICFDHAERSGCNLPGTLGHMAMFVLAFMVTVYHRIIYAVYVCTIWHDLLCSRLAVLHLFKTYDYTLRQYLLFVKYSQRHPTIFFGGVATFLVYDFKDNSWFFAEISVHVLLQIVQKIKLQLQHIATNSKTGFPGS